jgi:hypothetical protein
MFPCHLAIPSGLVCGLPSRGAVIRCGMAGLQHPGYNFNELSLRQSIAPPQLLGRVNSTAHLLFRGLLPVGAMAGGILAQGIGMRLTMFAGSLGILLSTLWLLFSPIRHFRQLSGMPGIVFDPPDKADCLAADRSIAGGETCQHFLLACFGCGHSGLEGQAVEDHPYDCVDQQNREKGGLAIEGPARQIS